MVTVFETSDSFALILAKASLDEADIAYVMSGDNSQYMAGFWGTYGVETAPRSTGPGRILVAREYEAEARELLEPLQKPNSAAGIEPDAEPEQ